MGATIRSWKREKTAEMTNARDIDDIVDNNDDDDYDYYEIETGMIMITLMMNH